MDPLRFGSLDDARTRYLFEGVVSGISGYGNSVGVPTVGGEVVFDDTLPRQPARQRVVPRHPARRTGSCSPAPRARATSRCCSARSTGRDGIGGASVLASAGFEEGGEAKRPSVQVGDPFEEKRLIEACLELLDAELAVGVQDLGAAGLSCAASETAAKAGVGHGRRRRARRAARAGHERGRGDDVGEPGAHARDRRARRTSTRCSSCARGGRSARRSSGASPTPGASACSTACSTRRRARREPAPPIGDDPPRSSSDRAADRRRAGRQPRRRPALPPPAGAARGPGRARRPPIPAARCAPSSPPAPTSPASCSRCSRRRRSPTRRGSRASTTTSCS